MADVARGSSGPGKSGGAGTEAIAVGAALLAALGPVGPADLPAQEEGHAHRGGHEHRATSSPPPGGARPGHGRPGQEAPVLRDGLGDHHMAVSTESDSAQTWFDQGLRLTYGFEHGEALEAFRHATRHDPGCAMCWWGIAWASGPNINAGMDSAAAADAREAVRRARARLEGATDRERAYVRAMAERYGETAGTSDAVRTRRDTAYARAMRRVADRWPEDADAQVLAAEALMLLSPWDYWTDEGGPKPGTEELLRRLRTVIGRNRSHAGACHFYIHAVEAAHPERAVPCAERIAGLMPGAGHVVHMPAHVYIRVGRYADAVEANRRALRADSAAAAARRGPTTYTLAYHPHNYHFLSYAAAMAGQSRIALRAARSLERVVDRERMREPGFAALQHYVATPLRVMVRFGMWDTILAEPAPAEDLAYPRGTWRYARAMAFARTGRPARAERELARLRTLASDPALEEARVWDLNSTASLLRVAVTIVEGELAASRGDYGTAVRRLQEGLRREKDLAYDEPPPWHLPVRHVLGAVLLEAGRPAEAESIYRRALERFPENGFALIGLTESLEAQGRTGAAAAVRERFREAWRAADVELPGSRF